MSMSDPLSDLLTRIRNGCESKHDKVEIPASRLKAGLVKVLKEEGFIRSFRLVKEDGRAWISVQLKYDEKGDSVIKGLRRVSRPGLRKYVGCQQIHKVRSGAGISILSTSKGLMAGLQAKTQKVGGELLCEVW